MLRLFVIVGILAGMYAWFLAHTTDIVLDQTKQLQSNYQSISDTALQFSTEE